MSISPTLLIDISKKTAIYHTAAFSVLVSGTIIAAIYVYIVRRTVWKQCVVAIIRVGRLKRSTTCNNQLVILNCCINPTIYFFRKHFKDKKSKLMAATLFQGYKII